MTPIDMGVAESWYTIKGRGRVACFASGELPQGFMSPRELRGHVVNIDNANYLVTGVEHFAIVCPSALFTTVCHHPFGLLVVEDWENEDVSDCDIPSVGALNAREFGDYVHRLRKANAELVSMIVNGHSTEIERLKGKAQGLALALSYLEEIPRCP